MCVFLALLCNTLFEFCSHLDGDEISGSFTLILLLFLTKPSVGL